MLGHERDSRKCPNTQHDPGGTGLNYLDNSIRNMKFFIDTKKSSLAVERKKVRTTHSERQELLNVEETESAEEKRLSGSNC